MNEKQEFELPTRWIPLRFSSELLGAVPLKDVEDAWYRCVIDEQLGLPHLLVEVVDVEDQVCRKALCGGWSLPGQADPNTSMVLSVRGIEDLPMSQVAKPESVDGRGGCRRGNERNSQDLWMGVSRDLLIAS